MRSIQTVGRALRNPPRPQLFSQDFVEQAMTPLERHKADLLCIIAACGAGWPSEYVMRLAEHRLLALPEESHCANHDSTQICPDCTS